MKIDRLVRDIYRHLSKVKIKDLYLIKWINDDTAFITLYGFMKWAEGTKCVPLCSENLIDELAKR
jgi:hypothetical protein